MQTRLGRRIVLGRAIRAEAERLVRDRGAQAECVAWTAARSGALSEAERHFREAVAQRVSRMFAFVGSDRRH